MVRRPTANLLAALAAALLVAAGGFAARAVGAGSAPPGAVPVAVAIDRQAIGAPVPRRFLGLSFEALALPRFGLLARRGDLVELLRSLGPGLLRFGGITADENVGWTEPGIAAPAWASETIGPADLARIGVLARRSGWDVLLTVGMAHEEPEVAAREVAAARRALGSRLAAVEIGNEPDAYGRHGFREPPWLAQGYEEEATGYREAIAALTPGVPIAGPDVSGSGVFAEWGGAEALAQRPVLLTGHHYPMGCAQIPPPSIQQLLSPATRLREQRSLETYIAVSAANGIPFRMDEAGSVSCGGVPGISDTFASALWATGYIVQAMDDGASGINLQGNPTNCAGYTPVCAPGDAALQSGSLRAEPDWYALLLTRALVGERPLNTRVVPLAQAAAPESAPNMIAAAFAGPSGSLRVMLVDDQPTGSEPISVRLKVGPGMRAAQILRLTGPSLQATAGVALGGRTVTADGSWTAPRVLPVTPVRSGVAIVRIAGASAALVTVLPGSHTRRKG